MGSDVRRACRDAATSPAPAPRPGLERARALGIVLVVVSACGFGSGALFAKPIYGAGLDWLALLTWRFLIAAVASWAWLLARPADRAAIRRLSRRRVLILVGLGVFYVGNSATYFAALETVPASLAGLIVYIYPAIVAVLAIRFGRRLQGPRPWFALALATVGVVLAVGGIEARTAPPLAGLLLAIASPLIYAVWIVLAARLGGERPVRDSRRTARRGAPLSVSDDGPPVAPHDAEVSGAAEETDPAPAAAIMLTATATVYVAVSLALARPFAPATIPATAWLPLIGVGLVSTALALQAFYAGARRIGAAQASVVSTVEPVYTIVLATALFGEALTAVQVAGGALVLLGVVIAQTGAQRTDGRDRLGDAPAAESASSMRR